MPVAVQAPQRREEKDPLDTIIKGLNIAHQIYGFKEAGDKAKALEKERADKEAQQIKENEFKKRELELKEQEIGRKSQTNAQDEYKKKLEIMKLEQDTKNPDKSLSIDKKEVVQDLSKKNASKIAIANQIDAVMSNWDNLDDKMKLTQGRQLIKTLNSPEGADAVGAEEAKRLGSQLEFAYGNFTNSNPTQFGRDLEGFKDNAVQTSLSLKKAIQENQKIVDASYGNKNRQTPVGMAATTNKQSDMVDLQKKAEQILMKRQGLSGAIKASKK